MEKLRIFTRVYESDYQINGDSSEFYVFENGELAMLCPECFEVSYFKIDPERRMYKYDLSINEDDSPKYTCKCHNCGYTLTQGSQSFIDPNIAEALSYLNKAGYETVYSCEGHMSDMYICEMSPLYITFKNHHNFDSIPEGWELLDSVKITPSMIDNSEGKYTEEEILDICNKANEKMSIMYMRSNRELTHFHQIDCEWKLKAINDITEWAKNLYLSK